MITVYFTLSGLPWLNKVWFDKLNDDLSGNIDNTLRRTANVFRASHHAISQVQLFVSNKEYAIRSFLRPFSARLVLKYFFMFIYEPLCLHWPTFLRHCFVNLTTVIWHCLNYIDARKCKLFCNKICSNTCKHVFYNNNLLIRS